MRPHKEELVYRHYQASERPFKFHLAEAAYAPLYFLFRGLYTDAAVATILLILAAGYSFLVLILIMPATQALPEILSMLLVLSLQFPVWFILIYKFDGHVHRRLNDSGYALIDITSAPQERLLTVFIGRSMDHSLDDDIDGWFVLTERRFRFLPKKKKHKHLAYSLPLSEVRSVRTAGRMPFGRLLNIFTGPIAFNIDKLNKVTLFETPFQTHITLETANGERQIYVGPMLPLMSAFSAGPYNNMAAVMNLGKILAHLNR